MLALVLITFSGKFLNAVPKDYDTSKSIKSSWTDGLKTLQRIDRPSSRPSIRNEDEAKKFFTPPSARESEKSVSASDKSAREKPVIGERGKAERETLPQSSSRETAAYIRVAEEKIAGTREKIEKEPKSSTSKSESPERERKMRVAELESVTSTSKPLDSVTGAIVPYKGPGAIVSTSKPLDSETGAIVPYKGAGAIVSTAKPLDSKTGAIVPYQAPMLAASSSEKEKKSGLSNKQKAAGVGVGAAAAAAGAGAVGLIGAGLVGAAFLGSDDKTAAAAVAPEKVEDIAALDTGSGVTESFEASPF